jgi:hypothetical protein
VGIAFAFRNVVKDEYYDECVLSDNTESEDDEYRKKLVLDFREPRTVVLSSPKS